MLTFEVALCKQQMKANGVAESVNGNIGDDAGDNDDNGNDDWAAAARARPRRTRCRNLSVIAVIKH